MKLDALFRDAGTAPDVPRGRAAGLCAAAVAGFVAAVLALQVFYATAGTPPPREVLDEKMAYLQAHADDYDVLLIGNSQVHRHFDGRRMADLWKARGIEAKVLNLGAPSLSSLELNELLGELEARKPARLKWVVLNPNLRTWKNDNWDTDRELYAHTWPNTLHAVAYCWSEESRRVDERARAAWSHLASWRNRSLNLGQGARRLFPDIAPYQEARYAPTDFERGGFVPLDDEPHARYAKAHAAFVHHEQRMRKLVARTTPAKEPAPLSDYEVDYLKKVVARIEALGARCVLVLGPDLRQGRYAALAAARDRLPAVPLLVYLNGHDAPELYQFELWHDKSHLNARGAALATERLAQDLARLMQTSQPPTRSP